MKHIIFIFLLVFALNCSAQKSQVFDTVFINTSSKSFFDKNPSIKELKFFNNFRSYPTISVYLKKDSLNNKLEYFNWNFIGDRYLFENKYGPFDLPEKEIQTIVNKKCGDPFHINVIISPDSIHSKLESNCPSKNEEDRIFTKVEIYARYKYGMKQLENKVQSVLDKNYFSTAHSIVDSVYFFKIIVGNKDSCLTLVQLIHGQRSPFTDAVIDALQQACGWEPLFEGGRAVNAYKKVYVRLNKDRKVVVAYPE